MIAIDLPPMTRATISLPFSSVDGRTLMTDTPVATIASEDGTRSTLVLHDQATTPSPSIEVTTNDASFPPS